MKKNLILFGTFIGLLILVYFLQEKRVEKEVKEILEQGRLISKPVSHLKWNDVDANRNEFGQWWAGDQLLSYNSLKTVEKKISEIKKIKDVNGDWNSFFPNPLLLEVDGEVWTIGGMNLDKTGFYMARGQQVMLAVIEGESQLTLDRDEIEKIKLDELKGHLAKKRSDLAEKQLFRYYPKLPQNRVAIEADGRLSFELDLKNDKTTPPPIPGISPHRKLREKFLSLLTQAMIKKEVPLTADLFLKKIGQIQFMGESGKPVIWELWLKSKKSADVYLIDRDLKKAYLMVGGTLKIFFIQIQDYWDKKNIPPDNFKSFNELPILFIQGSKSEKVIVTNREPLDFKAEKSKVNVPAMDSLIQLIFNLREFDQAERVSLLSKSERQMILDMDLLRLEVMGQELYFWRKSEELIVVNLTQGFKAHYTMLDENFHARFEDVLK